MKDEPYNVSAQNSLNKKKNQNQNFLFMKGQRKAKYLSLTNHLLRSKYPTYKL